jgi:hypothetical protein
MKRAGSAVFWLIPVSFRFPAGLWRAPEIVNQGFGDVKSLGLGSGGLDLKVELALSAQQGDSHRPGDRPL